MKKFASFVLALLLCASLLAALPQADCHMAQGESAPTPTVTADPTDLDEPCNPVDPQNPDSSGVSPDRPDEWPEKKDIDRKE